MLRRIGRRIRTTAPADTVRVSARCIVQTRAAEYAGSQVPVSDGAAVSRTVRQLAAEESVARTAAMSPSSGVADAADSALPLAASGAGTINAPAAEAQVTADVMVERTSI